MIVCLSVGVACLLRVEEAWFVNSEDEELRTDSCKDQKIEVKEF